MLSVKYSLLFPCLLSGRVKKELRECIRGDVKGELLKSRKLARLTIMH
jgi:hypothetical protein